jgi:hypothetical protein
MSQSHDEIFAICGRAATEVAGRPPNGVLWIERVERGVVEVVNHLADPILEVNATFPSPPRPSSAPRAAPLRSRHITTDPDERRTIGSSRRPSSLLTSRTRTRSAITRSRQIEASRGGRVTATWAVAPRAVTAIRRVP